MDRYVIPNLRNACRVLDTLSERTQGASLQSLSRELSIPRTTAFRILKTLEIEGYVREEERKYFIGAKLIALGQSASESLEIRKFAGPLLKELTEKTGETSHLAIPSDYRSLIVDVALSPHPLRAVSRPGALVDLHCSSTGKVFLAYVYSTALEVLIDTRPFTKRTPNTKTTFEELHKEIRQIRQDGYSLDEEEFHEGVRCIAVPIFGPNRTLVAALGITASKQRFPKERNTEMYQALRRTAMAIQKNLGASPAEEVTSVP